MLRNVIGGTVLAIGLVACGGADDENATVIQEAGDTSSMMTAATTAPGGQARAVLRDAQGAEIGTVTITQEGSNVRLMGDLTSLPAGEHGFHFHQTGTCEGPGFDSAGGHFNPTNASHGSEHPQGPHAGDIPNITGADGSTHVDQTNSMVTLMDGQPNSLFDADGTALVVHADPDDYETQPSGNAGARIACGVIEHA